jgi:hypothetical protein
MYLRTLSNRVTGYANVTTRQFLEHLYATYGRLSPSDLIANDIKMKSHYDPTKPIEVFFAQIEDAVALAASWMSLRFPCKAPQFLPPLS